MEHRVFVPPMRPTKKRPKTFGCHITELRHKAGLNSYEAAQLAGISQGTLLGWEWRGKIPNAENIVKLAQIYGVSLDTFLGAAPFDDHLTRYNPRLLELGKMIQPLNQYQRRLFFKLVPKLIEGLKSLGSVEQTSLNELEPITTEPNK